MLDAIEAWSSFVFVTVIISMLITVIFIWIGARLLRIRMISRKNIILAAGAATLTPYLAGIMLFTLPSSEATLGFFFGLLGSLLIIKMILHLTFQRVFLIWGFCVVAQISGVIITATLFIGGIRDLLKII